VGGEGERGKAYCNTLPLMRNFVRPNLSTTQYIATITATKRTNPYAPVEIRPVFVPVRPIEAKIRRE